MVVICSPFNRFLSPHYLVGGFKSSEKYEVVRWDDDIPSIWKKHSTNQLFFLPSTSASNDAKEEPAGQRDPIPAQNSKIFQGDRGLNLPHQKE
jgi:hypothetical protein